MGKMGSQLYRYANGLDDSPVRGAADREPIKSVGNSTTFRRDLTRWDEVQSGISLLSDSVAMRLRRYGLYCGGVQVGIKTVAFSLFAPDDARPQHAPDARDQRYRAPPCKGLVESHPTLSGSSPSRHCI